MARWLRQKMQELKIPAASCQPALQWAANFEGKGLVQITEQEFKARFPQVIQVTWTVLELLQAQTRKFECIQFFTLPTWSRETLGS